MDQFTSPGGCTCAITGRMHAVCDEHSSSNLMGCQRTDHGCTKGCQQVDRNQRAKLGGHQHLNARGILARTQCWQCPHGVPCPFGSFLSDQWHQPDFEDHKRARQKLPLLMAENGNACMTCAYLIPTPGFFAPFFIASVSVLMVSAVQIQMMDRLNEGWSLYTMYICTFCAWLNPAKVCSSSVKHLHNMHLSALSPQIQIQTTNTLDGLLMVV